MKEIINKFQNKKILVVGDLILDEYVIGTTSRISREAPVLILLYNSKEYRLGGAANTAHNLLTMGAQVYLSGVVGNDSYGDKLLELAKHKGINTDHVFRSNDRRTVLKTRFMAQNQQILRVDDETTKEFIPPNFDHIPKIISQVDAVVISDYAKGMITHSLLEKILPKIKISVVDPRPITGKLYKNAFLITPNERESLELSNEKSIELAGPKLVKEYNSNILITRGEKGMSLFTKESEVYHSPTYAKEVFDVSGAGDTAVAAIALALASGASLQQAAEIANHAAGIVVGKRFTSIVSLKELLNNFQ